MRALAARGRVLSGSSQPTLTSLRARVPTLIRKLKPSSHLDQREPTMSRLETRAIHDAVRDGIARAVAIIGLAGFALIHVLDLPDTMSGTPYIGWMYIGLIVSAIGLAGALVRTRNTRIWAAAAGLV